MSQVRVNESKEIGYLAFLVAAHVARNGDLGSPAAGVYELLGPVNKQFSTLGYSKTRVHEE